jgi:hypothetical protein
MRRRVQDAIKDQLQLYFGGNPVPVDLSGSVIRRSSEELAARDKIFGSPTA